MSGIAGIFNLDGSPVEPGLIERMTGSMAHRGPDEINHWVKGAVALGQCMLRTTPESLKEHQPLTDEDESLVLVMDGRLDNRTELGRALQSQGIFPRTNTDAELVLGAYRLWGEQAPQQLLGDFAYALWDAKRRQLLCVRDHIGARPLYYASNSKFFAFASDDEALLGLPGVSSRVNEELIASLLVPAFQPSNGWHSWLQDIFILAPAHSIALSRGASPKITPYWSLEPAEEISYATDQDYQDAFLDVFGESVRARMRTVGDFGAMMSGGLDSASIMAMVKRLLPEFPGKNFHTYSAISDTPESCVESQRIGKLTRDMGANKHVVSVSSFQGMVGVQDLIATAWNKSHMVDNSILLPAMMCLAASRDKNRVLLHGVSGDFTMFVPERYPAFLMRQGHWLRAWLECRDASQNHVFLHGSSPNALWLRNFWSAYTPAHLKRLARKVRRQGTDFSESVISRSFAGKINLSERLRLQSGGGTQATLGDIRQDPAALLKSLLFYIAQGLTGYEHMAGRFGVELRDPWADKRVVEFVRRLPLNCKIRNGWTKYLMRSSLGSDLDPFVTWSRGKEHLGGQFPRRLVADTPDFISLSMNQSFEVIEDFVDREALLARWDRFKTHKSGQDLQLVFDVMTLILWKQRVANQASEASLQ